MAFWFQLFLWVVSFVLSDYFREKLPSQTASGVGDFDIPTATEGRVVPIIPGGTARINAPNCVWYGEFAAVERTVTTGVIFKDEETIGFTYELALQYALCKNEVAGITGIWIGDDRVFDYVVDAGGMPQTVVDVDRDDLFGGTDNGGGFQGRVRLFTGSDTQGVSAFLDARIDPLPAYTGTCYAMITDLTESVGATIGETNQLRYIRIEVQAFDTVANGALGDRLGLGNDHHFIGQDANPISVAYELYINPRWGRGFPPSDVNTANFQAAAETCFTEGIGYTQVIDELTSTGEIQDTLEQHIDGYIGPNPLTGQIEVTLARQDYVLANEFQAEESNIIAVKKWSKGDWSETVNRVRLRYTDRDKDWNETHAIELAAGNRIIQGVTVTKELRFQGVHNADVASKIAARTRRGITKPQASGTIELDRTAYLLRPGGVFSFTSLKVDETDLAVRISKVSIGNVQKNTIVVEVLQDLFDVDTANVAPPPPTDFVPPVQTVIPFDPADQAAFEAPFILMRFNPTPNPVPRIATLARRNLGNTPTEYEVIRRTRNPPAAFAGGYISTDFVSGGFTSVGTLRNNELAWQTGNGLFSIQIDPIGAESLDALIGVYSPTSGGGGTGNSAGICVISPGLADEEWIVVQNIVDDLGGIRLEDVWRACMDTPMKAHALGARIWFIWTGGLGMGGEVYNVGDGVDMKFLPRSPTDAVLEPAATSLPEVSLDENAGVRNSKPLLPITITVNSTALPQATDEISFEEMFTGPVFTGAAALVQLRDWRNQSILGSVMGLDQLQTGFNPGDVTADDHQLQWFLHNLDTDPAADRGNAVAESAGFVVQATATDRFDMDKAQLLASGVEGFEFNARLEVEMRASPVAQTPLQVSHDTFLLDFIATGVFSIPISEIALQSHFDGVDAATVADEVSPFNAWLQFNGAAEIDTAESEFGGASLLLDGIDSYVRVALPAGWDVNDEWTIEIRARFAVDPVGVAFEIVSQFDGVRNSWSIAYSGTSDNFQFGHSTTGSNGPFFNAMHTGTFVPVAGTWYTLAFCKEPDGTFHVFVDGAQIGATQALAATVFLSGNDVIIGARNFDETLSAFFDGHMDEWRMIPKCLYQADYTIDTLAFDDGRAGYPLLAHFDGADTDTVYPSEDLNGWDITATGTSEIDTAQAMFGGASLRCDGVDDNATLGNNDGAWLPETIGARNAAFDFKSGPFTMQAFVRFNALPSTKADGMAIFAKYNRPGGGNAVDWWFYFDPNDDLIFVYSPLGSISSQVVASSSDLGTLVINTWYHAAVVRIGNDLHLYFEGNRVLLSVDFYAVGALNMPNDLVSNCPFTIARFYDSSVTSRQRALDGWIDEIDIRKEALYNGSTYTIPTAPFADPSRALAEDTASPIILLSGWENSDGFSTDSIMQTEDLGGARIEFEGSGQIDIDNPKFGSSSLLCQGTNDYATIHLSPTRHSLRDFDFTMDCWADHDVQPHTETNGGHCLMSKWSDAGDLREWAFYLDDAGATNDLVFAWSVDGIAIKTAFVAGVTITPGTFHHWECGRDGTTLRLFQDGVLLTLDGASDAIGTDVLFETNREIWIGRMADALDRDMDGHIDETRITKRAEHTATFTPETVAYPRPTLPFF